MFDSGKKGSIEKEKVRTILTTLGQTYDDKQLDSLLDGEDPEGKRQSTFSHKYLSYDT
jgi:calmodulin